MLTHSENAGQKPIIVIDFLSLTNCVARDQADAICGGRHQNVMKFWTDMLEEFRRLGCLLVFFSDLNIQKGKIEEWMNRRQQDAKIYDNLYRSIESGKTLQQFQSDGQDKKALNSTFYGLTVIANKYGEFRYATESECDVEIVRYANENNALAIISSDTDFLIYEGSWRCWQSGDLELSPLRTIEFDRKEFLSLHNLNRRQASLFATLLGNDFTKCYFESHLNGFFKSMGDMYSKFHNVANFVHKFNCDNLSGDDIKRIAERVFKNSSNEMMSLIRKSIDSYKTDQSLIATDDSIEENLLKTSMYRPYMAIKSHVQGITTPFYDMKDCGQRISLPELIADWIRRKKAIIFRRTPHNFTIIMRKIAGGKFAAYKETISVHPDCKANYSIIFLYNFF